MALGSDALDVGLVNESRGVEDWRVRTPSLHKLLARLPAKLGIHQRYQRIECVGSPSRYATSNSVIRPGSAIRQFPLRNSSRRAHYQVCRSFR